MKRARDVAMKQDILSVNNFPIFLGSSIHELAYKHQARKNY